MRIVIVSIGTLATLLVATGAHAATRTVGPGKTYAKPCEAIAAAQAGDVIEVDAAGTYDGDHCSWSTDNLTVRGVNGRAKIDGGKDPANVAAQKGIFVIGAPNATIENFELSGAVTNAGGNGAGIRHEGVNLTVRGCYFHDDQNGILGNPSAANTGEVLIENSEFDRNGAGDGYTHNMYLGHYAKFTLRHSYTHGAKVGHLVKSRALENHILSNRITDEAGTTASYEINLPNAGLSFVIGNLIEQSSTSENPAIIDYASESDGMNPDHHLFVVNNTIVNDMGKGTFVQNAVDEPAVLMNNVFVGPGAVTSQKNAVLTTNFTSEMGDPKLANAAAYDYHLLEGSPCVDAGTDPGQGSGQSLVPASEYDHPLKSKPRVSVGTIDIGAYELGNPGVVPGDAGADAGAPGTSSGDPASGGPGSGTSGGASSSGAGSSAGSGDDGGCGCRVHRARNALAPFAAVAVLGLLAARRRRPRASS